MLYIAAEIYGYSFANYDDHLGIGNFRYDKFMPEAAKTLERAAKEGWPPSKIAEVLKVDIDEAQELSAAFDRARQIVDAENPAEMFRNGVRFSIQDAVREGLHDAELLRRLLRRFVTEQLIWPTSCTRGVRPTTKPRAGSEIDAVIFCSLICVLFVSSAPGRILFS